jgi:hypothetical protein
MGGSLNVYIGKEAILFNSFLIFSVIHIFFAEGSGKRERGKRKPTRKGCSR